MMIKISIISLKILVGVSGTINITYFACSILFYYNVNFDIDIIIMKLMHQ